MALAGTLAAGAETVTVTAAGTLSGAVTDVTATDLTISGPIDAADLFWAADNMMSLKTLNLSGATIEAYDGDVLKGRMTYPAGAIPEMSFAGSSLTSIVFPTAGNITIGDTAYGSILKAVAQFTNKGFDQGMVCIGMDAVTEAELKVCPKGAAQGGFVIENGKCCGYNYMVSHFINTMLAMASW